jgi:chromate reductase, NAD(P)H dehydrogenase (quinone)
VTDDKENVMAYRVGYFVGSLAKGSINRVLSRALIKVAPHDLEFVEIPIGDLPLYSYDYDADYPPEARRLKEAIAAVDAVLFVSPEYNRGIPGALKNAIDWASRPWGQNSFARKPSAIIGASTGKIGTAIMQSNLRMVLAFCDSPQLSAPEAYIQYSPDVFCEDGEVKNVEMRAFLQMYMQAFRDFIGRVLSVVPQTAPVLARDSEQPKAA